jgi:thioredoxin reductase (NADPH)
MSDAAAPLSVTGGSREKRVFPTLTSAQVARIAPYGRKRSIESGQLLIEAGSAVVPFFVVLTGGIEIVRPGRGGDTLVAAHGPGQFSGEVNLISGRRALFHARASAAGEVLELDREQLMRLVQTDGELGEIFLRAFILRRVDLIAHGLGDVVLLGSTHCAATLKVREFLTRNGHPHAYIDLDRDADVQDLLDRFQIREEDIPVLICRGQLVLRNPTLPQVAECLGLNDAIDATQVRDLVIVGGGPAGLAAAVYGASEGLDVLVLEAGSPGGQAGSSSKIENYLGFPTGISGNELTSRAYAQAEKFGARVAIARGATRLTCDRNPFVLETDNAERIRARAVILATGAQYRKLAIPGVGRFEGTGIYYGATHMEAQLCRDEEVVVVGGGNSAGQAAVFLAETSSRVHVLVRSAGLADSMSRYLIRRIEQHPAIELHAHTEIVDLQGDTHLERVRWRETRRGQSEERSIRHVFVMTGAVPSTGWLDRCIALDSNGFIKTGPDLSREDLDEAEWPLTRPPHLLETSRPGIFAVGDVRGHNVKRIASAVGEGSIAVAFVHQVLQER